VRDIRIKERHAGSREFLEAPDGVKVGRPARTLQRTPAVTLRHDGLIADTDVEQEESGAWSQRGNEQRLRRQAGPRIGPGLHQAETVVPEMDFVGLLGG